MPHAAIFRHHDTVLVNSDGQIVSAAPANVPPTASAGSGIPAIGAALPSPFVINITYAASVAAAPTGFVAGVQAAVRYLQAHVTDAVTINITVGYGEVAGAALGASALGTTLTTLTQVSYAQIAAALARDARDATDSAAAASLPAASPIPGANYWVSTANARALGLAGPGTGPDGYVGFSGTQSFDYDPADGIAPGAYDFFAIAMHEFTEVMGRALLTGRTIGTTANSYEPMDLFQYAAPGVRDVSAAGPGYLSADGGVTSLGVLNTVAGGDAGDWGPAMGNDAFNAFSAPGVSNVVSAADLAVLDMIGWDLTVAAAPAPITTAPTIIGLAHATAMDTRTGLGPATPIAVIGTNGNGLPATLRGGADGAFALVPSGDGTVLMTGPSGLAGAANGALTRVSVGADTALAIVVGVGGNDRIDLARLAGMADEPAFIYGLGGNDVLSGLGTTSALWLSGGAGADRMSGGSGANTYQYGAPGDSTGRAMDIITNFNASADLLDFTALGSALRVVGPITTARLPAGTIGWQVVGGNIFIYVNTSTHSERLSATDMKIQLQGGFILDTGNILHA